MPISSHLYIWRESALIILLLIYCAISSERAVFQHAVGQNIIIARGRSVIHHIHLSSNCVDNLFILQDRNIYVLYTDTNFETMANNSLNGRVLGFAVKLLGKWLNAAVEPAIKPIKEGVAHTVDDILGHQVVKREWRTGFRVDDIKWNMTNDEPEIKWIYNPHTPAQERVFWFEKKNHRFVQVTVKEK